MSKESVELKLTGGTQGILGTGSEPEIGPCNTFRSSVGLPTPEIGEGDLSSSKSSSSS